MLDAMINKIKMHPDYHKAGMILCHNGVVRGASRDGRPVTKLTVTADRQKLAAIITEMKTRPGIIEVMAYVVEGQLQVGDDIMFIAVAGDIREHVFPVLMEMVNTIKKDVTRKMEH